MGLGLTLYTFLVFRYTFWKIGGGSDPSVTNVTLFLMKASKKNLTFVKPLVNKILLEEVSGV